MSREPNRRHGRSDGELRAQREEDRRQCAAWQQRHSASDRRTTDVLEMTMAKTQRRTGNLIPMPASTIEQGIGTTDADVARRAYELYEQRGGVHGYDVDDWLQAERELRPASRSTAA